MGIPSYFSFLLKNHVRIINKLSFFKKKIDNFYLDSNSIIYDVLRTTADKTNINEAVCLKIDEYIQNIQPNNTIFIAFDGVAPVAKMEQQRNRRYKSYFEKKIKHEILDNYNEEWNTSAITPGTIFMKQLGKDITNYYKGKERSYKVHNIIVSTSAEEGEGEHKLFDYIRKNPQHKDQTTVIYGLDADLIMLCLNHLPIARHIYLYRETPEFVKSINRDLEPNETYLMDIPLLSEAIIYEMNNNKKVNIMQKKNRLYDYIFLCFFLGNDFMPHFPSINIRTTGIQIMIDAYQNTIGKTNMNITNGKIIFWKNLRKLIQYLSNNELCYLKSEYKIRNRWEKRIFKTENDEDKMKRYLHTPIKNREIEKMVDPFKSYWEERYYKNLFHLDINDDLKKKICVNYLEGLEWTMNYYTKGCIDWKWKYNYHYPPLLKDLLKYIPYFDTEMIQKNNNGPVSPYVQLAYVLPRSSLYLLPKEIYTRLILDRLEYYPENVEYSWAFCKYIWEAHVNLPYVDINELEIYINNI